MPRILRSRRMFDSPESSWHISSMRAELQNSNIYPPSSVPNDFLYSFLVYFVRGLKLLFDSQRQTGYLFIHSFLVPGSTFRSLYTHITTVA
jgi:hypothetical protein